MHQTDQTVVIEAPAKINLCLQVIGRRPDGYHDLDTFMQKLVLADCLELHPAAEAIRLSCPGSPLPQDEGNLAFRAARLFFERSGVRKGVEIVLHKKIPIAAGLGGGSSDAAAVLLGLNRLYPPGLPAAVLLEMAVRLGADVPFFVADCAAARATGIGDRLEPAPPLQGCRVLLVNPGFPVSTRWVYENLALTTQSNPYMLGREQIFDTYREFLASGETLAVRNDLEAVTVGRYPELADIKAHILAAGAQVALMSGSGPTVFGLFLEEAPAAACFDAFARRYPGNVLLTGPRHVL
ncbi:MAG: 4-(cytidine 5'-diphospho)-2-C-methyl-D-erythritol kinase [Desulfobacteraceae bacterium]|nr:4-(cytidine 5'-diphospho)-2-C-methyl-D-erythritol kinase [Desulfobacteraceae bacterium]